MPDLDASWWTVFPPLAIAFLAVALPGGLVVWALRLRGLAAAALTPVASVALWAAAGVATQVTGRFTLPWTMLGLTLLIVGVALLIGRCARREAPTRPTPLSSGWVTAAVAASVFAMALLSYAGVASPALPNQTYDGVFHENLALWIRSTGEESAFQAYHLTDPAAANAFYPNSWHLLAVVVAAGSGAGIPTAFAAVWIVVCGAIWLPGVVWATDVIVQPRHRTLAAVTAALAASAFPTFPYLLIDWGTLYPTALAMALMPAGLAILVLTVRAMRGGPSPIAWPALLLGELGWLLALLLAHPRTVFTFAVLAAPYLVWQWFSIVRTAWRDRRRRKALLWAGIPGLAIFLAVAVATVLILRTYTGGGRPIADHLNGGPATAHFTLWEGLWQVLAIAPPTSPGDLVLFPSVLLALATLTAAVLAAMRPDTRWLFVAWGAVWVLYLLAATSNDDAAKLLTGVWYKDKYRIIAALPIVAIPMLAMAADRLAGTAGRRGRPHQIAVGGIVVLVAIASWTTPTLPGLAAQTATEYDLSGVAKQGRLIDADDVAVLEQAARIVPPGQRLLGDPWQGAIASWLVAGIEPVFPHFTGNWDADRLLVASSLPSATPEVCAALDRLHVHYLFVDVEQAAGRAPGAEEFGGLAATDTSGLGPVVASQGSARLIEIAACG